MARGSHRSRKPSKYKDVPQGKGVSFSPGGHLRVERLIPMSGLVCGPGEGFPMSLKALNKSLAYPDMVPFPLTRNDTLLELVLLLMWPPNLCGGKGHGSLPVSHP